MAKKPPAGGARGSVENLSITVSQRQITLGESVELTVDWSFAGSNENSTDAITVGVNHSGFWQVDNVDDNTPRPRSFTRRPTTSGIHIYYARRNNDEEVQRSVTVLAPVETASDIDYIYRRSATTPSTPTGGTTSSTHTPSGWQQSRPTPTETQGVYRARRRLTYTNGVFTSATNWADVFLVSAKVPTTGIPDSVFQQVDYIWRLSASRPSTPTGGRREENHTPHGWQQFVPSPTSTRSVYRARRFRTYTNQNFTSADQWRQVELRAASKPVYFGADRIRRLYYGSTRVVKLYRGSTMIFDDSNG